MAKEKKNGAAEQETVQDTAEKAAAEAETTAAEEPAGTGAEETSAEENASAESSKAEPSKDEPSKAEPSREELNAQIDALKDRVMRSAAEFDNYKKRTAKERDDLYANVVCDVVLQILPVLDNLQRAVDAAETSGGTDLLEGVKMIRRQFEEALGSIGVEPIDAAGKPFDPELHDAVMQDEDTEEEENTVTEELMKGYRYKGKVIRHSMVKVAK